MHFAVVLHWATSRNRKQKNLSSVYTFVNHLAENTSSIDTLSTSMALSISSLVICRGMESFKVGAGLNFSRTVDERVVTSTPLSKQRSTTSLNLFSASGES